MAEKKSFEQNLDSLQKIVNKLQQGDLPLEEAMDEFQKGIKLSQELQKTLTDAENKLTKVISADGSEKDFEISDQEETN